MTLTSVTRACHIRSSHTLRLRCGELFDATEVSKGEVAFVDEECVLFELKLRDTSSTSARGGGKGGQEKHEEVGKEGVGAEERKRSSKSKSKSSKNTSKRKLCE